jgi:alkylation response protein AidB-like acyl-CoA dehydrogenase
LYFCAIIFLINIMNDSIQSSAVFGLEQNIVLIPFSTFLDDLKVRMKKVFRIRADKEPLSSKRGIPAIVLEEIISCNPLSVSIPSAYGGRGAIMDEILAVLSAASYESLSLSLTLGINSALFLQPVAKFGREEVKGPIFKRFLQEQNMGGLMITEPDYGSNALHMQTYFTEKGQNFHIRGTKHWAGLTGHAAFWLLTAREQDKNSGELKRDIAFFICDVTRPGQEIVVEEFFDNLGLYQIPYGRNRIDVQVPAIQRLEPKTTGINMLIELLNGSRFQFPGIGLGFIQRMMDEAIEHCKQRLVGGKSLFNYDQVQQRLSRLQASFTISSAMCAFTSEKVNPLSDLTSSGLEANSMKTVITDLMHDAAQSLVQLVGAKAYRFNHIGGRGIIDSRPFQIFEGSNDILYAQISERIVKLMKKAKETNLYLFLQKFNLTENAAQSIKELLNFNLNMQLTQRKLVELGQVISRIISMEMVIKLGEKGFRQDLINNGIAMLRKEITSLMGHFKITDNSQIVEDYQQNSSWLSFV